MHASTVPEPFGQVVIEGMAAGLPVIASAAGGPLEVITNNVDGILTPPGDASALAVELTRLAGDPEPPNADWRPRPVRAPRDFSPERTAGEIVRLYARLVATRASNPRFGS